MADLIVKVHAAQQAKPAYGEPCNRCGWCCLTEVCVVGRQITGSTKTPCMLLEEGQDGKHTCGIGHIPEVHKALAMGEGCDAKTQAEIIAEMREKHHG